MSEWQPIETAPRDGRVFLGYGTRRGTYGYTEDETCCVMARYFQTQVMEAGATPRYSAGFVFTHWAPIPELPK